MAATIWMVFSKSFKDSLSCAGLLTIINRRLLYGGSVRTSWTVSSRTGALALQLLADARLLRVYLCSLKYGLEACCKAAMLVSRENEELPELVVVMFYGTYIVPQSPSEPEPELELPFYVAAVTSKFLATSPFFCFLYESKQMGRSAGRSSCLVIPFYSLFAALPYSSEERTSSRLSSRNLFHKARKAARTLRRDLARGGRSPRGSLWCSPLRRRARFHQDLQ